MAKTAAGRKGTAARQPCPICGRSPDATYQPFCSRRCADVDLARWLGEIYRVPASEDEPDDETSPT